MQAPRVGNSVKRAVVLRSAARRIAGPRLLWIVPFVRNGVVRVDKRTITTSFDRRADADVGHVPVNVDAVLFWMVHDAQKAALDVQEYAQAVSCRPDRRADIIGRTGPQRSARGAKDEAELQTLSRFMSTSTRRRVSRTAGV